MGRPHAGVLGSPLKRPPSSANPPAAARVSAQQDEEGSRWEAPSPATPEACWEALPQALLLRALSHLPRPGDAAAARLACAAWRDAHDGGLAALAPRCLPPGAADALGALVPGLTRLDLSRCRATPGRQLHLTDLTALAALSLPWGSSLSENLVPATYLPSLRRLSAKGSSLAGADPLAAFPSLTALDLSHAQGVACRAAYLASCLSNFQELRIAGVGLSGAHLEALLCGCSDKLRVLDVSGNAAPPPGALSSLPASLRELIAEDVGALGAEALRGLGQLTGLRSLSLASCELEASGPGGASLAACLGALTALEALDLSDCLAVGDGTLAELAALPCAAGLTSLRLAGCQRVTDAGAAALRGMPALTSLCLERCVKLSSSGVAALAGSRLAHLSLSCLPACTACSQPQPQARPGGGERPGCRCRRAAPLFPGLTSFRAPACAALPAPWISSLLVSSGRCLLSLDLRACGLPGLDSLLQSSVPALTALRSACLAECRFLGDAGVAALGGLTTLETLDLSHAHGLSDVGLSCLGGLAQLEELCLSECRGVRGTGFAGWRAVARLRRADLSGCRALTDDGLAALARPSLSRLDLARCTALSASGLAAALPAMRGLTALSLVHGAPSAAAEGLKAAAPHLARTLSVLDLRGCDGLTGAALEALKRLRHLCALDLTGCRQVLEAEIRELLLALPLLSELQVPGCAVSAEFAGEWRALPTGVGRKEDAAATSACRFTHCRR
eukprot:jgi/Tetstr1/466096/TSEL_000925.t2